MGAPLLTLVLLLVGCFSLATWTGPRFQELSSRRDQGFLASTLGESRKLFANHFFTRSDVYFHSGYYPSIFDRADARKEDHLAQEAGTKETSPAGHEEPEHVHGEDCKHGEKDDRNEHKHSEHCDHGEESGFLGKSRDVMDAFSRHFYVTKHTHLTEKGPDAAKEILPWIKLAAKLDPNKIESYTVGAYWLRSLKKDDEAEQFLREGFRRNPQSHEILLELGRGYYDKREFERAQTVLELALNRWREQEEPKSAEKQNRFAAQQILNYLAVVEDRRGNRERAISLLQIVKKLSPMPEEIEKRIAELRAGQPLSAQ